MLLSYGDIHTFDSAEEAVGELFGSDVFEQTYYDLVKRYGDMIDEMSVLLELLANSEVKFLVISDDGLITILEDIE